MLPSLLQYMYVQHICMALLVPLPPVLAANMKRFKHEVMILLNSMLSFSFCTSMYAVDHELTVFSTQRMHTQIRNAI